LSFFEKAAKKHTNYLIMLYICNVIKTAYSKNTINMIFQFLFFIICCSTLFRILQVTDFAKQNLQVADAILAGTVKMSGREDLCEQGGTAVFNARAMLASLDRAYIYDDEGTCAAQGIALRKAPTKPKTKVNASVQMLTFAKVSPNPAVNNFNLSVSDDLLNSTYNIVDATGKVVLSNTISNTNQDIDVANISTGVYYIKIVGSVYLPIKLVIIK
jgi:Secretion system C-terminal sorting domain